MSNHPHLDLIESIRVAQKDALVVGCTLTIKRLEQALEAAAETACENGYQVCGEAKP